MREGLKYLGNSESAILHWAEEATKHLSIHKQATLMAIAKDEIKKGGLRGDVSTAWSSHGYTMADIPGMYP